MAHDSKGIEFLMGKLYPEIDPTLKEFIAAQKVFFVATAPAGTQGHINLSPKGLDTLRILGPRQLAYLDYTGSGIETVAHLRENGRIAIMLCAFQGPPRIVRLHGRGQAVEPQDPEFAALLLHFTPASGVRAIIVVQLDRISDSCGYGVPLLRYEGDRPQLVPWSERRGAAGLDEYRRENNAASIDGLPGLRSSLS
jgi:Pyridoxamine 5'-phosphate oxidase